MDKNRWTSNVIKFNLETVSYEFIRFSFLFVNRKLLSMGLSLLTIALRWSGERLKLKDWRDQL